MNLSGSWDYIQDVARSRLAHNKTRRHVTEFGPGIELLGVAGEIVARRFLGIEEKLHDGFDHGVDIDWFGMKIDVKATVLTPKVNFRYLQWPIWKKVKSDIILFTTIDPLSKTGTVLGYATKDEILKAPVNSERFTACHEVPVSELHPAWELHMERVRLIDRRFS